MKEPNSNGGDAVDALEGMLQAEFEKNSAFNEVFNGDTPIEIPSRITGQDSYKYNASDLLFWTDRKAYLEEFGSWQEAERLDQHDTAIQCITDGNHEAVFSDLVHAIARSRIAPFVGAGMAKATGLPLWGEALEEIHARITSADSAKFQDAISGCDYLEAAELLWKADKEQVKNFIRTRFAKAYTPKHKIEGGAKLLPRISHGCIVTTNFDSIIETLDPGIEGYMHGLQQGNKFVTKLIRGDRCILKLHGDAEDPDTFVFTKSQYDEAYGAKFDFSKPLPRALRQIFISHSLLFLGCSMERDRTLELLEHVRAAGEFDLPDHYAILPEPAGGESKAAKEGRLLALGIRPIWYPAGEHGLVENLIQLALAVEEGEVKFP